MDEIKYKDEHIIEAIGKTRVVIRDGKVVEVSTSSIKNCPLAERFEYPVHEITPEAVKANIEHRIKSFGMCTSGRKVIDNGEFVGFGASELIANGLVKGFVDAAVVACDGAGTVIALKSALVQGIGGRMSGLVKTSPIPEVIARIESEGGIVISPDTAGIDQVAGVRAAYLQGFCKVAVTIASAAESIELRSKFNDALIIAVHVTGVSSLEAEMFTSSADIITCCKSEEVRLIAGKKALLQAGVAVPIFAMTAKGKDLVIEKARNLDRQILIKSANLPV